MAKIIFVNTQKEETVPDGSPLRPACEKEGIPFPCGDGFCGACIIEIVEGMENLSDFTDREKEFFGTKGNERLACQCKINKNTVKVKF